MRLLRAWPPLSAGLKPAQSSLPSHENARHAMASYQYIYVMQGLSKTYPGGRKVLDGIHLSFLPGAKIGVLGPNGAGKSTLLKIMAGLEPEFVGEAWSAEGAKVGFLPQEPELDASKNVQENVLEGLGEIVSLVKRYEELSLKFGEVTDVKLIGVGETPEDVEPFVPDEFVEGMFG